MHIYIHVYMYYVSTVHINAGMLDCLVFGQSGTGMKKTNDAGTDPVLD
jgi:hypothetical protein